jgi:hypothetical protein
MEVAMTDPAVAPTDSATSSTIATSTAPLPPEHPVERQLAAYNAHDLDAFVASYSPDVRLINGDGTVRAEGLEQFRAAYVPVFAQVGRRAEIVSRIAIGNWVIDHERVHRADAEPFDALVGYRLVDGEIVEAHMFD